jgi:uncharacterized protein YbaR (Trm112 family)
MFACPYCKEKTDVPGATVFWMVHAASAVCEHCAKEFVIVDNFPMTQEQYREASPNVRPLRAAKWESSSVLAGHSPDPQA